MQHKLDPSQSATTAGHNLQAARRRRLLVLDRWLVRLLPLLLALETATAAAQASKNELPPLPAPIANASALLDGGRVNDATALLELIGSETLAKEAEHLYKTDRAKIAKCQYFLGAYADCLDNVGPVLVGSKHSPFGVHYYGAKAASRLQLWPLVARFASDPERLAQSLAMLGERVEDRPVRELNLCLAVALARMDRFDEARGRIEKLVGSAKTQDEAASLRACLTQLAERQRAVRSKAAEPFDASALWLKAVDSPSWWVQACAMGAVAKLPDPTVYDKLAARLKHPRWEVRDTAIDALSARGDRRAIPILRPLLQDPNANVRESAKLALKELGEVLD